MIVGLMNINIVCVGKIKENYLQKAVEEYSKRLSLFCKLSILEVPEEKAPDSLSKKEIEQVKNIEGSNILKQIKDNMYCIVLEIKGKMLTSEELSNMVSSLAIEGKSNITFVIGGSHGLSVDVIKRANMWMSFSPLTFPHQLMRVILLEQVYRSFKIINNQTYHK